MSNVIVVTRHPALVEYLVEKRIVVEDVKVLQHATKADVEGMDVVGVLPLHLACHANSVLEVPLKLTPAMRGKELTLAEVRQIALPPRRYQVMRIGF